VRCESRANFSPPVGPLRVTIRQPAKPTKVTFKPSGSPLAFDYQAHEIRLNVPPVAIHEVVVVE